jgi:hypothetical protein
VLHVVKVIGYAQANGVDRNEEVGPIGQLLERLEKKGIGNPTTLRSLKTYARKA